MATDVLEWLIKSNFKKQQQQLSKQAHLLNQAV